MARLEFEIFKPFGDRLVYGISTAEDGNMSFLYGEADEVAANRLAFLKSLAVVPDSVAVANLSHGDKIIEVGRQKELGQISRPGGLEADTLVTTEKGTHLFMVVADCLALFYLDPVAEIVALAHAGWRGVDRLVPEKTVRYLVEQHRSRPENLRVALSPALQKVSAVFRSLPAVELSRWGRYIEQLDVASYRIDWIGYAYDQLVQAGVRPENIERSLIDTRTNSDYFSHRRSQDENLLEARFGCLLGLRSV